MKMSKREALKEMMGQAKLMEIIDQAYENAKACENCAALAEWWEAHGSSTAPKELMPSGRARR